MMGVMYYILFLIIDLNELKLMNTFVLIWMILVLFVVYVI